MPKYTTFWGGILGAIKSRLYGDVDWRPSREGKFWEVLKFWDAETGAELCSIQLPYVIGDTTYSGTFASSPDGRIVVSNCGDFKRSVIVLWEIATGRKICRFQAGTSGFVSLALSPDNQFLAIGAPDSVTVWQLREGQQQSLTARKVWTFTHDHSFGQDRPIAGKLFQSLAFSPDSQTLASGFGNSNGGIILWNMKNGHKLKTFPGHLTA